MKMDHYGMYASWCDDHLSKSSYKSKNTGKIVLTCWCGI